MKSRVEEQEYEKRSDMDFCLNIIMWVKCHKTRIADKNNKRYETQSENETSQFIVRNRILFITYITHSCSIFRWNSEPVLGDQPNEHSIQNNSNHNISDL